ncbi:hypothetical protein M9H77_15052 [Catharanthus roseus]|uniref:Uncharacterized protein n=1 Tax=Catharanthus roseus TaxID=4058 RepID=A0ACC0BPZ5_CATRO|nr:hypothetical protein M9H77_15052 [Catharanthus roseus]
MAMANPLSSSSFISPLIYPSKTKTPLLLLSSSFSSSSYPIISADQLSILSIGKSRIQRRGRRKSIIIVQSKGSNSADAPDRLISAICYFYPFFDGIQYGKYVITQFSPIQTLIQPLIPAIRVFKSFPFNGFLVFLTLYFVVVRNNNFSRYVRFNTMQAIVLDVLLIFPDLLERSFNPKDGFGLDLMMSFDSTVFLFLLVCLIYGSSSCLLGQVPRLPLVADAADRQVL